MAITKILYMKDCGVHDSGKHLRQAINYILVPEKTGEKMYVSSVNCQVSHAYEQMKATKIQFGKRDKRQGYHIIISFEEGEVDAATAFEIVGKFVDEYLKNGYEAVYAVHDNTDHIHGHIIFNSVNCITGKKFRYEKGDWAKYIQPITNRLCEEYGLSTIFVDGDRADPSENYTEWWDYWDGKFVWSDMIKRDLDACVLQASDFEEFISLLQSKGYEVKQNKYFAVKPPGLSRFRRCYRLGEDYSEERLRERIVLEDLKHYRDNQSSEARILKVAIPYHLKRAKLSGLQRRYFAKLYRIGMLKQRPYSRAYKYRDEIRKMHKLHDQYMFLADKEIHPIFEGAGSTQLNMRIGHMENTAPLCEKGNVVLAGHNGSRRGVFFTRLNEIKDGAKVKITNKEKVTHTYEVYETGVYGPYDETVYQQSDEECLTLFTCAYSGTRRFVVRCRLVDPEPESSDIPEDTQE